VRSFVGAMIYAGITRGIFMATSGYTRGARALQASDVIGLELRDGTWLLDGLRVKRRARYTTIYDEQAPFWRLTRDLPSVPLIDSESYAVDRPFGT